MGEVYEIIGIRRSTFDLSKAYTPRPRPMDLSRVQMRESLLLKGEAVLLPG